MMYKPRLLLALLSVSLLLFCASAYGQEWTDSLGQVYAWNGCVLETAPEIPDVYVNAEEDPYVIEGASPTDPTVKQTITNRTALRWTDWHITIFNGAIIDGSWVVYKIGTPVPPWQVTPLYDGATINGLFCNNVIGSGTYIDPGQKLYVEFSYNVIDPGQNVTISQYPTDYYPIPEPASLVALLSAIAAMGFSIRRRA